MSSTQRIGNARATNEWGEDRARSGSWTGKAELKEEPGSQATALARLLMEKAPGQTVTHKLSAFRIWS